jgi:hypothetical protein
MWLINTTSLELNEFIGSSIPRYTILSHTWGDDEVFFKEMRKDRQQAQTKRGFSKIQNCCLQAKKDGLEWAWIDSCCIDKRSSAELSEAINSMFKWYEGADVCYAYLEDVPANGGFDEVSMSRWFTRGWTVQELLAPKIVQFYSCDWTLLGTRSSEDRKFTAWIYTITGIHSWFLLDRSRLEQASVAMRMSWAAERETTRLEDRAYSLMGLFKVHIPILYGEGLENAFERLQLEIIQKTSDQSIFAWRSDQPIQNHGLLAPSPAFFKDSKFTIQSSQTRLRPFSMTNIGMKITFRLFPSPEMQNHPSTDSIWVAVLRCWTLENSPNRVHIYLKKRESTRSNDGFNIFQRVDCHLLRFEHQSLRQGESFEIYVPGADQAIHLEKTGSIYRYWADNDTAESGNMISSILDRSRFDGIISQGQFLALEWS